MIIGIDHIEIIVRDVKEFVDFYQKMGFELLSWTEHHGGSAEMRIPGPGEIILEIHTLTGEENPGVNHISFRCDDVAQTHADLSSKGIAFPAAFMNRRRPDARIACSVIPTAGASS